MSLFELLENIIGAEERNVELELPEEKINLLSLKILRREAERRGKVLRLNPSGPRGERLLACAGEDQLSCTEAVEPSKLAKKRFKIPRPNLTSFRRVGLILLLLFGISLFVGGGAYWAINFLPRAEVTLTLQPIPLVKELSVSADPAATSVDAVAGTIPGKEVAVEADGQKTVSATGTATVGEKATGEVRFFNGNDEAVHISKGDEIVETGQGLVFVTVMAVEVPPASSDTTVGVTAGDIGGAYNLAANKLFEIGGQDGISARNDAAFTGGESHQVTIVSSVDQAKVLEELKAELLAEGKEALEGQVGSGWQVAEEAISEEQLEKTFLQNIGDQADTVGLTLKLKLTTVAYHESDLGEFISAALADLVPDGYELYPGEMGTDILNPELSNSVFHFSAKVSAQVIPQLDLEGIKSSLAGRNANSAQEYLASLSSVTAYELRLWPNLPEKLRRVPKSVNRIRIELKTEE